MLNEVKHLNMNQRNNASHVVLNEVKHLNMNQRNNASHVMLNEVKHLNAEQSLLSLKVMKQYDQTVLHLHPIECFATNLCRCHK